MLRHLALLAASSPLVESTPGFAAATGGALGELAGWFAWELLLIPPITGIIGYMTNWVAIWMLFHPLEFRGVNVPGLESVTIHLPRRFRQIPGVMEGKLGWQGIIPSKARKMGSINVDTAITKIATQKDIYEEFDPDRVASYVAETAREDIREEVVDTIRERNPELWDNAPEQAREAIRAQIDDELPAIIQRVTEDIGENVDDLLNIKLMVIEHLGEHPEHVNEIFLETGDKEFDFLINSGFYIGILLGCLVIPLYVFVGQWWVLPVAGVFVGLVTNWLALKMIFHPMRRREFGRFTVHGIFLRRQDVAAETYAGIVADKIVTLGNVADNMIRGPSSDRTERLVRNDLRAAIDDMFGPSSPVVQMMGGTQEYEGIREAVATNGVEYAVEPMRDAEINDERSDAIEDLLARRMKELPPDEFARMLRAAFKEDEWLLIAVGGALGFVAGWIQLLVVTSV